MSAHGSGLLSGLKRTARIYFKSKIGIVGLAIILFFVILAVFAPQIDSTPPTENNVGAPFSIPVWATIFPQYRGYPATGYTVAPVAFASAGASSAWPVTGATGGTATETVSASSPPGGGASGSLQVNATIDPSAQNATDPLLPNSVVLFSITHPFQWTTKPPYAFTIFTEFDVVSEVNISTVYLNYMMSTPNGTYSLGSIETYGLKLEEAFSTSSAGSWLTSKVTNANLPGGGFSWLPSAATAEDVLFAMKGNYSLTVQVRGVSTGADPSISVDVSSVSLYVEGNTFGVLGTTNLGNDVWSQLVWGSQVSLLVGIFSGLGAVALGTLAGLSAGYVGGLPDEVLSRFTDFFLVIPFLPLLIILLVMIRTNEFLRASVYFWVIVVLILVSWPSIARIIRSQVLSVKERQYVEASRALGGGTGHIIRKHILPNVMGLVYSQVALNVGGFILLEAALDYLAVTFTSITTITWGDILSNSLQYAVSDKTQGYVWWWFLPPGISIASLSLAFVLVGFALDSIFNPRLRAR